MTFEDNCDKNSVIKSKQNGNLGSDETNTVGIKITHTEYPICIEQACSFAEVVSRISNIWFLFETSNKNILWLSRSFLIDATILLPMQRKETQFSCTGAHLE